MKTDLFCLSTEVVLCKLMSVKRGEAVQEVVLSTPHQYSLKAITLTKSYRSPSAADLEWLRSITDDQSSVLCLCMDQGPVLSPDDALVLELWPHILADDPRIDGANGPERLENSRIGRAAYLHHLPSMPVFTNRGTKASTTRWFSWTSSWSSLDVYFHTKLLVVTLLCMSRGWAKSLEDLKTDMVVPESKKRKEPEPDQSKAAGSSSKGSAVSDARAQVSRLRQHCANSMHLSARLMWNSENRNLLRMLYLVTRDAWSDFSQVTSQMRGRHSVAALYAGMSRNSWMQSLCQLLSRLRDGRELARCGMSGSSSGSVADVHLEDSWATTLGRLVLELLAQRTSSMYAHCRGYPLAFAGALGDDEQSAHTLEMLENDFLAFAELQHESREIAGTVLDTHPLHQPVNQLIVLPVFHAEFKCWPARSLEIIRTLFCLGQSRIIEDANQKLRDIECRTTSSKEPIRSGIVEKYGFNEITAAPSITPTPQLPAETLAPLFQSQKETNAVLESHLPSSSTGPSDKECLASLNRITGQSTWETSSLKRAEEAVISMAAATRAWQNGNFRVLADAWMSSLIPERQLLLDKSAPNQLWMVLRKYAWGILVWPCEQVQERWVTLSTEVDAPTVLHVWSLDSPDWHVVPSAWKSPSGAGSMGLASGSMCIRCTKPARPVLQYLAETGFAMVSLPDGDEHVSYRDSLSLRLMRHLQEDLSDDAASRALLHGRLLERPHEETAIVELEFLREALQLPGDQRDLQKFVDQTNESNEANAIESERAKQLVAHVHEKAKTKATTKHRIRWTLKSSCNADAALAFVAKHGPELGSCCVDHSNGRLFLIYPEPVLQRKSISWHKRGWSKCVQLSLTWLWERSTWHTGRVEE
eukprot:6492732-Amphidinium_carterae.1